MDFMQSSDLETWCVAEYLDKAVIGVSGIAVIVKLIYSLTCKYAPAKVQTSSSIANSWNSPEYADSCSNRVLLRALTGNPKCSMSETYRSCFQHTPS
ncbi:hypothetical protein Anapl_16150 [Anas platyrhynchos]|uniref:Uncharacterized protein n=1 Tax=Anas platyrhynchos TaxID=8839 RepID=R0KMB6_ANAPL|nr:hypothetical protein Anapl_16150 [Anas platyrhynchos]